MKRATLWLAVLLMAFGGVLRAQDDDEAGRGVARISVLGGDVSVRRGDSGEWVAAALNAPLVSDDALSTGGGARAEVQFDYANLLRVASNAEVRLAQLEDQRYIVQIARGTVTFRVLRDSTADVELNTPSVSIRPVQRGTYRITVREDGESEITVRSGEVEIYTPTGTERLGTGRTMQARDNASDPEFRTVAEIARDSWDEWNVSRDQRLEQSRSYQYADRTIYGAEDLDDYGTWVNVTTYGHVWRPRVEVGWSPYYNGRWVWLDYYGWTWQSYDSWGWAPYHYGRWMWDVGNGWCWWPGDYGMRHHWSPALVAFFGYGYGGIGAGFGYGRVGWVPLGPREPYHRWYGRDYYRGYRDGGFLGDRMGMRRDYDIRNNYMNARAPNGMAGVDAGGFGRGGRMDRVRGEDVGRAGLVQGVLPVAPGRESQRLSDRNVNRASIRTSGPGGNFAGRTQIRRDDRVPFEDQRRGMERGIQTAAGRAGSPGNAGSAGRQGGEAASAGRQGAAAGGPSRGDSGTQNVRGGGSGWRRMGDAGGVSRREGGSAGSPGNVGRQGGETTGATRQDAGTLQGRDATGGGWRRLGGATGASDTQATPGNRTIDRGGSQQGRPTVPAKATGRESTSRGTGSESGWRSFENRGNAQQDSSGQSSRITTGTQSRSAEGTAGTQSQRSVRINPPLVRERQSRSETGGNYGGPSANSQPRYSSGSRGNYGSMENSRPSYSGPSGAGTGNSRPMRESRPSYSGPSGAGGGSNPGSMRNSAPSYSGGGGSTRSSGPSFSGGSRPSGGGQASGGGGARMPSGGGGGGARPSGGGSRSR